GAAGGSVDHGRRGHIDFHGHRRRPGVYVAVLFPGWQIMAPLGNPSPARGAPPDEVMISIRDLRVSYGDREILHGVSFDVLRGETMVILGGSGSGKSTLLRTLVGLEKPSSGEIWIRGKNTATMTEGERDET